jgi:hypothetical protein
MHLSEAIISTGLKLMSLLSPEFNAAWFSKERMEHLSDSKIFFMHIANKTTSFTLCYHTYNSTCYDEQGWLISVRGISEVSCM